MEFLAEVLRHTSSALKLTIIEWLLAEADDLEDETLEWIQGILDRGRQRQLKAA